MEAAGSAFFALVRLLLDSTVRHRKSRPIPTNVLDDMGFGMMKSGEERRVSLLCSRLPRRFLLQPRCFGCSGATSASVRFTVKKNEVPALFFCCWSALMVGGGCRCCDCCCRGWWWLSAYRLVVRWLPSLVCLLNYLRFSFWRGRQPMETVKQDKTQAIHMDGAHTVVHLPEQDGVTAYTFTRQY